MKHKLAVKKVKFSPFESKILASASQFHYFSDMTAGFWDISKNDIMVNQYNNHTEFVMGIDFNLFNKK